MGAVVMAEKPPDTDDGVEKLFLPFARKDETAVKKEIDSGDPVYLEFELGNGELFTAEGESVNAKGEWSDASAWALERWYEDGKERYPREQLKTGCKVKVKHIASGLYLTAQDDAAPLTVTAQANDGETSGWQLFTFWKEGRPLFAKHKDTVFLETCLSNFIELEGEGTIRARRWARGQPMTMTIYRKLCLDTATSDKARRMQFQAFDLDGNGTVS